MNREFKTLKEAKKFCKMLRCLGGVWVTDELFVVFDSVLNQYEINELRNTSIGFDCVTVFKTTRQDDVARWLVAWYTKGEMRINTGC